MKATKPSIAVCCLLIGAPFTAAQCDNKTGFAKQACEVAANGPSGSSELSPTTLDGFKGPALTTGFADTIHLDTLPSTVEPKAFKPLARLDRTDDGSFILKAGIFEAYLQSYSLEPGDLGGNRVAGFYPASIKGRRAKVIAAVLKQTELHPDVPQPDVQQLLWAIVGGADLEKMPPPVQQTAARILPRDVLAQLQGAVQAKAAEKVLIGWLNRKISKDPAAKQSVGAANQVEGQMRQDAGGAGAPQAFKDAASFAQPVVRGTWGEMPGGYFVRYLPEGSAKTRVEVIVPDAALAQADPKAPLVFDPTQFLAVYTQSPALRLGVTMRPVK
jgi:hypothetical protein